MADSGSQPYERPESELLRLCARVNAGPISDPIVETTRRVRDWNRVEDVAYRHGISSLLYHNLRTSCSDLIPQEVLSRLAVDHTDNVRRSIVHTGEMFAALELLSARGIEALGYKGQALAAQLYDPPSLRIAADIDLLVRPSDATAARSVLTGGGYRPTANLTPEQERRYVRASSSYTFLSPHHGTILDVQWAVAPPCFTFRLPLSEMWPRKVLIAIQGRSVPVPSSEDLLASLCVHGSKHIWEMAKWLCDVAELARQCPNIDYELLLARADEGGYRRPVLLGLALAASILDAPVPVSIRDRIDCHAPVQRLAGQIRARLFETSEPLRAKSRWEIQLEEKASAKAYYALHRLFAPESDDWVRKSRPGARILAALERPARRLAPLIRRPRRP